MAGEGGGGGLPPREFPRAFRSPPPPPPPPPPTQKRSPEHPSPRPPRPPPRHRLLQQRGRLRHPLPRHRRDVAHDCPRPPTPGGGNRLLRGAPHLGPESALSSPPALRRSRRRPVGGSRPVDSGAPQIPAAGQGPQRPLPATGAGRFRKSSCRRPTPVLRRAGGVRRPPSLRPLSGSAGKEELGGLRQGPFWRTATRAGVF